MEDFPAVDPEVLEHYRGLIPGLTIMDGIPRHAGVMNLETFQMRDEDVLITGYPKSGTHWLAELLFMISHRGDETKANEKPSKERIPLLELDAVHPERDSVDRFKELPSPRFLISHSPSRQSTKSKDKNYKTFVIFRNPKDVAVSYFKYHQVLKLFRYDRPWRDFLSLFLNGEVMHGSWFDVVLDWWKRKDDPNVFFVKYEDLKKDLKSEVKRLAAQLEISLTSDQITKVIHHCNFDIMRDNPMSNPISTDLNQDAGKAQFMRKGIVGDWKHFFTVQQSEMFDNLYQKEMKDSSLELQFELK